MRLSQIPQDTRTQLIEFRNAELVKACLQLDGDEDYQQSVYHAVLNERNRGGRIASRPPLPVVRARAAVALRTHWWQNDPWHPTEFRLFYPETDVPPPGWVRLCHGVIADLLRVNRTTVVLLLGRADPVAPLTVAPDGV